MGNILPSYRKKFPKPDDDDNSDDEDNDSYVPRFLDIYSLGICIVVGGQYYGWMKSLVNGFGSAIIAMFLIGTAYVALILCNAEVTSALPMSGGSYAVARCTLGFFPG